ncbi:MalM family protein, partial [Motilimonas sp. E26]|uniref:MalM family protein n=1 Tax=Motilimonas sp. E26 TaxID=2865674 RepID=UPI001E30D405
MTKTNLACCLLLATLLLSGCANTQPNFSQLLAARTNCVDEFDQYSYINFDEDGQVKAMLGSQESQCGVFSWGATFVLPIVLPASGQDYQLVIDSFVGIDSILSPMALFLNEQHQPVAQVGTEQFGYSNRRYRAVINVNSREREHFRYLLLTTDPKALGSVDLCCIDFVQQYIGSHIIANAS